MTSSENAIPVIPEMWMISKPWRGQWDLGFNLFRSLPGSIAAALLFTLLSSE
jgi:hypothetical protein